MPTFGDNSLPVRFWEKVTISDSGCWEWTAYRTPDGYGRYALMRPDGSYAVAVHTHRITYAALVGEIASGAQIDHLCRNRSCCNPSHLESVTQRVNIDRGENYIAINRAKTHCLRGHVLAGENLIIRKRTSGTCYRSCRECRDDGGRALYQAKKAAMA